VQVLLGKTRVYSWWHSIFHIICTVPYSSANDNILRRTRAASPSWFEGFSLVLCVSCWWSLPSMFQFMKWVLISASAQKYRLESGIAACWWHICIWWRSLSSARLQAKNGASWGEWEIISEKSYLHVLRVIKYARSSATGFEKTTCAKLNMNHVQGIVHMSQNDSSKNIIEIWTNSETLCNMFPSGTIPYDAIKGLLRISKIL